MSNHSLAQSAAAVLVPRLKAGVGPRRPIRAAVVRWAQHLLIGLLLIVGLLVLSGHLRYAPVHGESMAPTLHEGDTVVIENLSYWVHEPARGEIVFLQLTSNDWILADLAGNQFVKRIIGLPGEQVELHGGHVYINGQLLSEPYVSERVTADLGPVTVPPGSYFVLGDNSRASDDSRLWGAIPRSRIHGRVVEIFRLPGSS